MARRFEITGGSIRNIALAAAFLAADDGQVVNMGHLIRGTQRYARWARWWWTASSASMPGTRFMARDASTETGYSRRVRK